MAGEKIDVSVSVKVSEGPTLSTAQTIECDAYDKAEVVVATGGTEDVEVQPSPAAQVELLVITASKYEIADSQAQITYQLCDNAGDPTGSAEVLNGPLVLVGSGAVDLLGGKPWKLQFVSTFAEDVTVEVLVGRMASAS